MVIETKRVYRPNELREPYGLPRDLVFKEIGAGRLRSFTIGKARYIRVEAVEEYLQAREAESRD